MSEPVDSGPHLLGALVAQLEARSLLRSVMPGGSVPPSQVVIGGVTHDSRKAASGRLYCALPGQRVDGHSYAMDAVAAGASALLVERAVPGAGVPQLLVHRARPAFALAAAWINGYPSHSMGIIGITGTDGKTTTAYLIRAMLEECGLRTGMIGTIDVVVGGRSLGNPERSTTPEADELQARLAQMRAAGDRFAVVESTSHGLAQDRVGEVAFDVAVLTNLTHEHLEFHRTAEAYASAKRILFQRLAVGPGDPDKGFGKWAVINADDAQASRFSETARQAGATVLSYGVGPLGGVDIRATAVREEGSGSVIEVSTPRWAAEVRIALPARFNVHNALAAMGVGEALGLDPESMRRGLAGLRSVPGRMESIDLGQPFRVVVDYAHTPDALAKVLDGLAPLAAAGGGGLVCVFGSAGDRDTDKRPMMGRVAGSRCRLVVLTDEDPRAEDRSAILEAIAQGAESQGMRRDMDLLIIADRTQAIVRAIELARSGDVVVLAGKGHERTIEVAGGVIPWDESAVARNALRGLGHDRPD
ncbi:UDP-N-acetylmuramoyl-L-alanyl-D-glutamate--2,6-diaminopimelate ligase [soil metagenome]